MKESLWYYGHEKRVLRITALFWAAKAFEGARGMAVETIRAVGGRFLTVQKETRSPVSSMLTRHMTLWLK